MVAAGTRNKALHEQASAAGSRLCRALQHEMSTIKAGAIGIGGHHGGLLEASPFVGPQGVDSSCIVRCMQHDGNLGRQVWLASVWTTQAEEAPHPDAQRLLALSARKACYSLLGRCQQLATGQNAAVEAADNSLSATAAVSSGDRQDRVCWAACA